MKKILVIGDFVLDKYIFCEPERINREAPILIYRDLETTAYRLGGAGNVVANLAGLEQRIDVVKFLSNDSTAQTISKLLVTQNVDHDYNFATTRTSSLKTRFFAEQKQIFRVDTRSEPLPEVMDFDLLALGLHLKDYEYAIISDYNLGTFNHQNTKSIIETLNAHRIKVIVDPRGNDWTKYENAFLLTPNLAEFSDVVGREIPNNSQALLQAALPIIKKYNLQNLLVTRSEKGMILFERDGIVENIHAKSLEAVDVSGAGDTVVATLAAFLNLGKTLGEAIVFANHAASIVIQKIGVVPITMSHLDDVYEENKVYYLDNPKDISRLLRKYDPEKIVLTNGAFDILHYGHITYLNESATLNKYLVVGINSNASVKRYKDPTRPINDEKDRALTVASLPFVKAVVIFNESTAERLIKAINPFVYTKGADYKNTDFPELHVARKTIFIDFKRGYSSSQIIAKIANKTGKNLK